ncbi:pteridine reductase [uncultured Thiobacillus sp.]|jgi:pteridine reductase|uniref:pteridine reductase n=1 Tax=uncultured Thiobacillus sp. TaxID=189996 RepID=UPI00086BE167|nr:pteridine reductase [uncultured Thiobacillus sp.]KAB2319716.1 pteridine reductase [Betaproteobacteria bacterium SCN1]MBN8759925.1 pteridine reductase [Thiobacillus sp.]ODU90934.1 MAG: pteridine reductase [Thiobacillus sp. SCN 65-179]OJW35639.1 MAG: pteridine reductase [Thiobacillus sp. 65-69]
MHGKVVLITGGARRVGAASARLLHAAGARLMIHYRSSAGDARALQAELNALRPDSVALIQADLLDIGGLPALINQTVATFGGLDVLLNNASSFYPTPVGDITEKDWLDLMGSNLKAPLFLSQAAAPELRKRRGCIINITDIHAERPMKSYVVYSVAKAGLVGLTKSLARELAPEVRVNGIAPGPIAWPEDDPNFDEVSRQRIVSHTMLKHAGEPNDIALAVRFFAKDAPFVTGQILAVDGGRSAKL